MSNVVKTEVKTITPKMCIAWLENNKNNRPLKQTHINSLAKAMVRGDWVMNGESLKFDTRNSILDGQHRMWACVESGVPIKTMIVTGLPRKVFDTLDIGSIRKASDILSINGEVNVSILVSGLKHIARYYSDQMMNQTLFSPREVEELLDQHPDIREYASILTSTHRVSWCAPSILITCWYLASRRNKEKADEFFDSFIKGANLTLESPILVLRNKFIDVRASAVDKLHALQKIELIILCWNMWRSGKTVRFFKVATLKQTSADFPSFK